MLFVEDLNHENWKRCQQAAGMSDSKVTLGATMNEPARRSSSRFVLSILYFEPMKC